MPSGGYAEVLGVRTDSPEFRRVKRWLAYLPEEVMPYDNLTGRVFIGFIHGLYGVDNMKEAVELSGLGPRVDDKIKTYSKGMRRRLVVAALLTVGARLWPVGVLAGCPLTQFKTALFEIKRGLRRRRFCGIIFVILLPVVFVRRGDITMLISGCVGDLCTVTWRGEKCRVECTPSFLLTLAVAPASAEGTSHIDIYRQLARQVFESRYQEAAKRVGNLLREK